LTINPTLSCNILAINNNFLIQSDSSVREALKQMDLNATDNLILLSGDRVVGFFSSGDFRRLVYKGVDFESQLARVIEKDFIFLSENYLNSEVLQTFQTYKYLKIISILDLQGRLIEVLHREDYIGDIVYPSVDIPIVIMAGGLGSRLAPLTDIIPKPLIPMTGETVIKIIIDSFKAFGFHNFHISVNYQREIIKAYLNSLSSDYLFNFIEESSPMGTAGALHYFNIGKHDDFFVINCDTIINVNYSTIYDQHVECKNDITIVASMKDYEIPYGICEVDSNGTLLDIKEKPTGSVLANTGMYIINKKVLDLLPGDDGPINMDAIIKAAKDRSYNVGVFPISNKAWQDVGQWKDYINTINER